MKKIFFNSDFCLKRSQCGICRNRQIWRDDMKKIFETDFPNVSIDSLKNQTINKEDWDKFSTFGFDEFCPYGLTKDSKNNDLNLPPIKEMMKNLISSGLTVLKSEKKFIGEDEFKRRIEICKKCNFFIHEKNRCSICGCFIKFKNRLESLSCPLDDPKW